MKIAKLTLFLVVVLMFAFSSVAVSEDVKKPAAAEKKAEKPRLAVKELKAKGIDKDTAATLTDLLCSKLSEKDTYQVLCSSDLRALLQASQQTTLLGGCDDGECMTKLSKALNAPFILNGSVGKVEDTYVISLVLMGEEGNVVKRVVQETKKGDLISGIKDAGAKLLK